MDLPQRLQLPAAQAARLLKEYGSPLYVYSEEILRRRCREMLALLPKEYFRPNYSAKANTNLELLRIICEEGLSADAMSPGEMLLELAAGFAPGDILFVSNNVADEEFLFAAQRGILVSVDSLSQLESYGKALPGTDVAVRINPGVGAGHSAKVVTGGKSKFGIEAEEVPAIRAIAAEHGLRIAGLNQHIGSLFLEGSEYLAAAKTLFDCALQFDALDFVDLGGGFGVPYHGEARLDLAALSARLRPLAEEYLAAAGRPVRIKAEPGRYVVAECGLLLGTVHSVKNNFGETYVGTDIGFNVLMRPVLYDSYHEVVLYPQNESAAALPKEQLTIVGNICESGDILAKNRSLAMPAVGDAIGVEVAGAYGYCMASNYNSRLRPAEVLLCADGSERLIRRRDSFDDLLRQL